MTHRFADRIIRQTGEPLIDSSGNFTGCIATHTDRLSIPMKRKKPTVYAVWNDLFHEDVPDSFIRKAYQIMFDCPRHTFLILTKRAGRMADYFKKTSMMAVNVWHGLTVVNQQEADEKIPVFLKVPGKKFLSIEPMLSNINILPYIGHKAHHCKCGWHETEEALFFSGLEYLCLDCNEYTEDYDAVDAVILGGETGPGARPMHPDWVRSIRDQCSAAGVPFFFKSGGSKCKPEQRRLLDGRTHDALPWVKG